MLRQHQCHIFNAIVNVVVPQTKKPRLDLPTPKPKLVAPIPEPNAIPEPVPTPAKTIDLGSDDDDELDVKVLPNKYDRRLNQDRRPTNADTTNSRNSYDIPNTIPTSGTFASAFIYLRLGYTGSHGHEV